MRYVAASALLNAVLLWPPRKERVTGRLPKSSTSSALLDRLNGVSYIVTIPRIRSNIGSIHSQIVRVCCWTFPACLSTPLGMRSLWDFRPHADIKSIFKY